MISRWDALLWSINEQLAGRPGLSVPRLTNDYLQDVIAIAVRKNEELEDMQNDLDRQREDT